MRRKVRRLLYLPLDIFEKISGKRDPMAPPRGLIFTGSGDFISSGKQLLEICIKHTNLKPEHQVLDVGCGIGRLAVPLTGFLNTEGKYEGFDVVADGINWCTENITSKFPNFRFTYTPLRNDLYNLKAVKKANRFEFPYADKSFDLVVLTSVFTHMQYEEVFNYLKQISRVLKPGGKCMATFFVIDETTLQITSERADVMQFDYEFNHYYLHDASVKDANIAFKHDSLKAMIAEAGLNIVQFNKGWWRGTNKKASLNYQDVLIMEK